MTDNNINEIKKAEEEAGMIVEVARKEAETKKAEVRNGMKNAEEEAREKLEPKMKEIEKETSRAIADYEKTTGEEQGVVMEKLDDVDEGRVGKAVDIVIEHLTR